MSVETRSKPIKTGVTVPRCSDFDADCEDVPDKVHCYLYDPVRGYCPYLRDTGGKHGD